MILLQNWKKTLLAYPLFFLLFLLLALPAAAAEKPVVFYTDIIAGPNTGGENGKGAYLSIFGKNFGTNLAAVKVFVGAGEVARYVSLGASMGRPDVQQLSVQIGPAATSGNIKVLVNGVEGNTTEHSFTVRTGDFYYVSLTGNNSTGQVNDIAHPYRTVNYVMALPEFQAGDFMVLRGGNYILSSGNEGLYNGRWMNVGRGSSSTDRSGTSDTNAITVYGYPGELVNIDWGTYTAREAAGIKNAIPVNYYVFANMQFDLKNSGSAALELGSYTDRNVYITSPRMVNLRVTGGMANAEQYVNSVYIQRAENFKLYGMDIGNQSKSAWSNLRSHMIYVSHAYTNGDMGWNYIHDNAYGRAALQIAGDAGGGSPYLHGPGECWGYNTNVRVHDSLFRNLPQEAILTNLGSFEVFIYNNVIINGNTRGTADASPIALRGDEANSGSYYLYNNTVYTNMTQGGLFELGLASTWPKLIVMYNNVFYGKSSSGSNYYQVASSSFDPNTKIIANNNLWYGSSKPLPAWEGDSSYSEDPQFLNPELGDFRTQLTSKTVGGGNSLVSSLVKRDYNGLLRTGLYDIGAVRRLDKVLPSAPLNLRIN